MARNFRIRVVNLNRKIVFKLRGDLDGSSAFMILRKMKDYQGLPVILDFSGVRKYYPFGLHVLNKRLERKRVVIKDLNNNLNWWSYRERSKL